MTATEGLKPTHCGCDCPLKNILAWENPTTTVSVWAALNSIFFGSIILRFSFVSLLCGVAALALAAGLVLRVIRGHPAAFRDQFLNEKTKEVFLGRISMLFDDARKLLQRGYSLYAWDDTTSSAYAIAACLAVTFILRNVMFTTTLWLGLNVAFLWVHVASLCEKHCSKYVAIINKRIADALNKIPRATSRAHKTE